MPPSSSSQKYYAQRLLSTSTEQTNSSDVNQTMISLNLQPHPEGGYFVETDRDPLTIMNPFYGTPVYPNATNKPKDIDPNNPIDESLNRNASTSIFYYLCPSRPVGMFHRNKGRTIHTLHRGRGVYIIIHADEANQSIDERTPTNTTSAPSTPLTKLPVRIETFTVGPNITAGEKLQWIVEGGKFKASFLLPDSDADGSTSEKGLLISETVVPGFEFVDHDFLTAQGLTDLTGSVKAEELRWLVKQD